MAIQLWSQPDTSALIQQLIDIETQVVQLNRWKADIANFHRLIDEREVEAAHRTEQVKTLDFEQQLQHLSQQVKQLSERINRAEQENKPELLANEESLQHQARLDKAQSTFNYLAEHREMKPAYAQRLKRLQGVLQWQLSEAFPENLWQNKKQLTELGTLLAQAEFNKQKLLEAMDRRASFEIKRKNIDQLAARIDQQFEATESLKQALLTQLVDKNMDFLANERTQLNQYLYQAKLSKLRLQDKAYAAKERLELASAEGLSND